MSYISGPKTVKDGLIFYIDAANSKSINGNNDWYDISINKELISKSGGISYLIDSYSTAKCIQFDGVNDYIQISNTECRLDSWEDSITIEVWINIPSSYSWNNGFRTNIIGSGSYNGSYGLHLADEGMISAWARGDDSGFILNSLATNLNRDTWYNITMVYEGVSNVFTSKIYKDGVLSESRSNSNMTGSPDSGSLNIGYPIAFSGSLGGYFRGLMAVAKVYNRPLSSGEVLQNFNALKERYKGLPIVSDI